ncbi:unnamed protein product [Didymodactylos carnosus]|nr:unnamed protein product [Didymodactylos carnosus]CAF3740075.1 unnamed protein product [Didymodactylos carnosus]
MGLLSRDPSGFCQKMTTSEFVFIPPPEAPVFYPTYNEFQDPLEYIEKIRPIASRTGICKIVPPKDWQPPFCVQIENFKFTPRIQRINELEAGTRVKLTFYERLTRLFDSQGIKLKIPTVEKQTLDLAKLHKIVKDEGGYDICCSQKKWSLISRKMSFRDAQTSRTLKQHYEKLLLSYDVYEAGIYQASKETSSQDTLTDFQVDYMASPELKKLQFHGAGPKTAVPSSTATQNEKSEPVDSLSSSSSTAVRNTNKRKETPTIVEDPFDNFLCKSCNRGDDDAYLLICDRCDNCYHTYCLIPPLIEIPRGQWRCPKCVAQLYQTACPLDAYGFEQSRKQFTLQEFGEMADNFKQTYFQKELHNITCEEVEKEFWRVLASPTASVKVEYGADLPTGELGSGFPTVKSKDLSDQDKKYLNSPWNLNNFAYHYKSVLRYLNADISGMKIPWAYVGMLFSCFCWHVEDHWSYSINYLHWGEPKTWYGVPGTSAEKLETCFKSYAPELFAKTPDLLHHLVTIMSPSILMKDGVPVVRLNQYAGEFVVTFPRAYHTGFNQGYNFAEAVNFCPADWLLMGRCAIDHYKEVKRYSVFSHDELVCKLASECQYLDPAIGEATKFELESIVKHEKNGRKLAYDHGAANGDRVCFELMPDDERQCDYCKTTCFLSAVSCSCKPNVLVCINHIDQLCTCIPPSYCLWFRYTCEEMSDMLEALRERLDLCQKWKSLVNRLISNDHSVLVDFNELERHTASGALCLRDDIRLKMEQKLSQALECRQIAKQLLKRLTYKNDNNDIKDEDNLTSGNKQKVTLGELHQLSTKIKQIGITFTEMVNVQTILSDCIRYQDDVQKLLLSDQLQIPSVYTPYIDRSDQFYIQLPIVDKLHSYYQASLWKELVQRTIAQTPTITKLKNLLASGQQFCHLHPQIHQTCQDLQEQLNLQELWEEKSRLLMKQDPSPTLEILEKFVENALKSSVNLPSINKLKTTIEDCKQWNQTFEQLQSSEHYPFLYRLEQMYSEAKLLNVDLFPLKQIDQTIAHATIWLDKTLQTFKKHNSQLTLLEIITPRVSFNDKKLKRRRKTGGGGSSGSSDNAPSELMGTLDERLLDAMEDEKDPATIYQIYRDSTRKEIEAICDLRENNQSKQSDACSTYCLCEKQYQENMTKCQCLSRSSDTSSTTLILNNNNSRSLSPEPSTSSLIWWCDSCIRSCRPRLEDVVKLLANLQKLTVRLPEGEILQCLTERAMTWQDKAK